MAKFIVRITARSYEQLRGLDKYHLDLKKRTARQEGTDRFIVTGILSDEQIQQVKSAGYTVEVLSDLSQMSKERTQEVSLRQKKHQNCVKAQKLADI
jgi:carboxypeptidase T